MPTNNCLPIEQSWSDLAHREIMVAFPGQLKSRAVALCVWVLARKPDATREEMELVADADPELESRGKDGKKISTHAVRQAKKILGLAGGKTGGKTGASKRAKKKPGLSKIQQAILDRYQESTALIDEYLDLADALALVNQAFEAAQVALRSMTREHALTLAEVDPRAARVLALEGILGEDEVTVTDEPYVVWPDEAEREPQ